MPGLTPSSPPNASGTVRGLVSTVAQTFAGVKTFLARAVFSLGITSGAARLDLRSDLGAGASDVCSVVGSTVADASVNTSAKLWSARSGLGSTEIEKAWVADRGMYLENILEVGGRSGVAFMDQNVVLTMNSSTKQWLFNGYNGGGHVMSLTRLGRFALAGAIASNTQGATAIFRPFDNTEPTLQVEGLAGQAVIQRWRDNAPQNVALVTLAGRIDQRGTDSGASPGAATADRPAGVNAIASGATSVTITNNLVAANSRVMVTFHADHGAARWWVTRTTGSFTVTLSAAATANAAFSWEVSNLL